MATDTPPSIALLVESLACLPEQLIEDFQDFPLVSPEQTGDFDFVLQHNSLGWNIQQSGKRAPGPVRVDFNSGAVSYRRNKGGGEMIVKAVAGNKKQLPTVLDATAGLGGDSFVLASWGYCVSLMERSPIAALLLTDGLERGRASDDKTLRTVVERMEFQRGDSLDYLQALSDEQCPDVVYIDPMFPSSKKSALVKKEMQVFQQLVGADPDSAALLSAALKKARHRVVVKRPLKAECLAGLSPAFALKGKAVRFDIYTIKAFDK